MMMMKKKKGGAPSSAALSREAEAPIARRHQQQRVHLWSSQFKNNYFAEI